MPRGRPREFDTDAVVERAMNVFWSSGYHGTSLPDLLAATRLSRGSLYAAFGDKHGLFLRALDRYIDAAAARLEIELSSPASALAGLRTCLAGYVGGATALGLGAHDAEVKQRIRRFFKMMETRFAAALARAKASGELAADVEPASAARMLLCLVEGMRVVGKADPDRAMSRTMVGPLVDRLAK